MENTGERFERSEDVRRISHPTQEEFGRGERSRLPIRFALMHDRAPFYALFWIKHLRYVIGDSRGANVA